MAAELVSGQHAFETGQTLVAYYVRGRGPPCFVAPYQWGMNSEPIRSFFKPLERHMTMVYHDPPGTGRSSPPSKASDLGMERVVSDIFALQSRLNVHHTVLIGHSGGAAVALTYALRYPERVSDLVLVGAGASYPDFLLSPEIGKALAASLRERDEKSFRHFQSKLLGPEIKTTRGKLAMGRAMKSFLHFNIDRAAYSFLELSGWDVREKLGNMAVRTLIVAGKLDKLTPPGLAMDLHERIRGSKLVVFARCGHFSFLDEPERFYKIVLGFLEKKKRED